MLSTTNPMPSTRPANQSFCDCDSIKCVFFIQWKNEITQTQNHRIDGRARNLHCLGLTKHYCLSILHQHDQPLNPSIYLRICVQISTSSCLPMNTITIHFLINAIKNALFEE